MTYLFLSSPDIVRDLGWTLIHFLWQGLVLAALLQMILPMCRGAVARHNWALGTLAMMAAAPVMTFLFIHGNGDGDASMTAFSATFPRGWVGTADAFAPISTPSSWIGWLVVLWLAGIAVLSLRALGGWYMAETLRRRDTLALPADLLQRCHALKRRLAVSWPIRFLQSHRVSVPVVVGWFHPVVLIPISLVTGLPPQQLDALIMHELAHIRRLDAFVNIMLVAIETVLFYHPAIWWVSRRVRIEREHCCDDFAVSACGDAAIYVEALTSMGAWKASPIQALAANGGKLKARVARLLGARPAFRGPSVASIAGLLLLCSVMAAGIATAYDQTQSVHPRFAIRVVDDSVRGSAQWGPPGDDRVRMAGTGALWLKREGQIVGKVISDAVAGSDRDGNPVVVFRLTPRARNQFAALTRTEVGHRLAIVVNGTIIQAPIIREPMLSGQGEISGNFTMAGANALAAEIRNLPERRVRQ